MNTEALPAAVLLVVVLIVGIYDTRRLRNDNAAIAPLLKPKYRDIGRAFVVASVAIVVVVGWYSYLTVRRLLDLEPFDWSPIVSLAISIPVLLLPRYFRRVWQRVGSDPEAKTPRSRRRHRKGGMSR